MTIAKIISVPLVILTGVLGVGCAAEGGEILEFESGKNDSGKPSIVEFALAPGATETIDVSLDSSAAVSVRIQAPNVDIATISANLRDNDMQLIDALSGYFGSELALKHTAPLLDGPGFVIEVRNHGTSEAHATLTISPRQDPPCAAPILPANISGTATESVKGNMIWRAPLVPGQKSPSLILEILDMSLSTDLSTQAQYRDCTTCLRATQCVGDDCLFNGPAEYLAVGGTLDILEYELFYFESVLAVELRDVKFQRVEIDPQFNSTEVADCQPNLPMSATLDSELPDESNPVPNPTWPALPDLIPPPPVPSE